MRVDPLSNGPRTAMTVVAVFDLGWGEVAEFAVEAFVVEPCDPPAGRDLEVVESAPRSAVAGERGGVAPQLGLEQPDHALGHRVIERIADGPDRGRSIDLVSGFRWSSARSTPSHQPSRSTSPTGGR